MPGKITTNLSTPSIQALRAERHQESKGSSFWNQWSNLSTGQKWGRALAWVIPPIGIGFQIKANHWQAKAAAPRPGESRIALSEEKIDAYPLKGSVVFGKADRDMARGVLAPDLNKTLSVIQQGDQNYPAEMVGLPEQFAKDLNREPNHCLQSQNGNNTVQIMPNSDAAMRPRAFRDFFRQEFPGDSNKADQWAIFAAKFLNQNGSAPALTVTMTRHGYAVPNDDASFNLKMENGGNSALVEIRAKGHPNKIQGIDSQRSTVDNFLLMRITLGPPEDLTVLSGYANHELVPEQPSENSEVENDAPVQQPASEELISSSRASNLLQQFSLGMVKLGGEQYKPLQRYKDHLAAQEYPDLTAFKDAFTELEELGQKQKLIGELADVIKDKDFSDYGDQIDKGSEFGQLLLLKLNEENLNALYDSLLNDRDYPLEEGISKAQFLVDANDYQLYSMGIKQIPEQEVLNLEKRLVPLSKEYAAAIADGTASSADIRKMVEKSSNRLLSIATESTFRTEVSSEETGDITKAVDPRTKIAAKYPLSSETILFANRLSDSSRDFDIQNFAPAKGMEEVATRLLGMTPEAYFSASRTVGATMVIGGTFFHAEDIKLHPTSQKLRTDLVQAFNQSTTLDDFYSKASTLIENIRQPANN